jgi:hypothetical protein
MKYVISSPSRTGSTLLYQILNSADITDVLHTHNCLFSVDDPANTIVLFSLRRDLFRSIMSCLIGKRTQMFHLYDTDTDLPYIEPFSIECLDSESEFQKQYRWHKWYVDSHDLSRPYRQTHTFYLEDFVNDYDRVYRTLGLEKKHDVVATIENTYRYQDLVVNHEQCRAVFDQLETTAVFVPILKPYDPNLPN